MPNRVDQLLQVAAALAVAEMVPIIIQGLMLELQTLVVDQEHMNMVALVEDLVL